MGGTSQVVVNRLLAIAACCVGLLASLPWLYQLSYSRGYDFFLWIYNAWFLRAAPGLPNWSSFAASGQPFFKIGGLSDAVVLAALSTVFGTFGGAKVFVALFYVIAAAGTYTLALRLASDRPIAIVCSTAYVFSWFLTITVYFQGYLSNFMVYAALPWFLVLVDRSVHTRRIVPAIGGGILLGIAISANAQVAIKILAFATTWVFLRSSRKGHISTWGRPVAIVTIVGLWLASFNVVSALGVWAEVFSVAERTNDLHAPWELFLLPAYCLNYAWHTAFDSQLFEIPLRSLRFSGYPGLSVLFLAGLSWPWTGKVDKPFVKELWILSGIAYLLYWLLGLAPASSWVGISHNLLVFPTLTLALLSGFGVARAAAWSAVRFGRFAWRGSVVAAIAMILVDLGGASILLNRYGVTTVEPESLPEAKAWAAIAPASENRPFDRMFSYNPDHTIYLYPVLAGGRTANVIELRQRNPEYQSYLNLLKSQTRNADTAVPPSQLLSLLDVRYVDVPSKAYTYTGPRGEDAPYARYERGLTLFESDPNLRRIYQRSEEAADVGWAREATSPQAIYRKEHRQANIAQTIYANKEAYAAFIPESVVALAGNTVEGESVFEQVAASPYFEPARVGYLLVSDEEILPQAVRGAIGNLVGAGSWRSFDFSALYNGSVKPNPVNIHLPGEEAVTFGLRPADRDRFVFLSQQYFRSWRAYDGNGEPLHTFKAGAGLTAVFVPAVTAQVVFKNELSDAERWGRGSSLLAVLLLSVFLMRDVVARLRRRSQR